MSNFINFLEGANPVSPFGSTPSSAIEFGGPEYASIKKSKPMTMAQLKYFPEQQQQLTYPEKRFQNPEQEQQLICHEKRNQNQKIFKHDYAPRPGEQTRMSVGSLHYL